MLRTFARSLAIAIAVAFAGASFAQTVDAPLPGQDDSGGFRQFSTEPDGSPAAEPPPPLEERHIGDAPAPAERPSIGDAIDPLLAPLTRGGPPPVDTTRPGIEELIRQTSVEVDWRVENPFRFFADP
jgi:hypothetical protein